MSDKAVLVGFTLGLVVGVTAVALPTVVHHFMSRKKRSCKSTDCSSQTKLQSPTTTNATPQLESLQRDFHIAPEKLQQIIKHFNLELDKGLAQPNQTIRALPSYVTRLPTGQETGVYLALDLGGTNLRVCEVVLEGHGKFRMRQKKYKVSDELKTTTANRFFDYIAECVGEFIKINGIEHPVDGEPWKLGFTFSFPVDQTALNVGLLCQWNKGFEVSDTLNKNVVEMMARAFKRKKLNIKIVAIVNDTVGTLVTHRYVNPQAYIGVILGTGSNAAYVEKVDQIPKWTSHYKNEPVETNEIIINIEWGAFDNEKVVLPITKYDSQLDSATENPGKQIFEKMISGMYLGEICRLTMVDLIQTSQLFQGTVPESLKKPYAFETEFMSRIERDHSQDLTDVQSILKDLFKISDSTLQDRLIIKRICELVGMRSARLSAAAVAAVVMKMNRLSGCTVAIDGSVFEHYPHYSNRMKDALREIFGASAENLMLELARDGSGVGAALVAAVMS